MTHVLRPRDVDQSRAADHEGAMSLEPQVPIDRWFRVWQRQRSPLLRLVCLPYAGGQAHVFSDWAAGLGPRFEVWALQLPGRGVRFKEQAIVELGALLDAIEPPIAALGDAPLALFGHSMGATIAFELARRLRRRGGAAPVHLFLSGACAPERLGLKEQLHQLPDAELVHELRRFGGTPEEVFARPELLDLVLPWLRTDLQMLETWSSPAAEPLAVPITVFGGNDDHRVPREELAHWRPHAAGPFSIQTFASDHFYLNAARGSLLASIARALERASRTPRMTG